MKCYHYITPVFLQGRDSNSVLLCAKEIIHNNRLTEVLYLVVDPEGLEPSSETSLKGHQIRRLPTARKQGVDPSFRLLSKPPAPSLMSEVA